MSKKYVRTPTGVIPIEDIEVITEDELIEIIKNSKSIANNEQDNSIVEMNILNNNKYLCSKNNKDNTVRLCGMDSNNTFKYATGATEKCDVEIGDKNIGSLKFLADEIKINGTSLEEYVINIINNNK